MRNQRLEVEKRLKIAARIYVQMETGTYDWEAVGLTQPYTSDGKFRVIKQQILIDVGYSKKSPAQYVNVFQDPVFLAYRNLARKRFRLEMLAKESPKDTLGEELIDWVERELLVRALENPEEFSVANLLQLHKYLKASQGGKTSPKEPPKEEESAKTSFPEDWDEFLKKVQDEVPQDERDQASSIAAITGEFDSYQDDGGENDAEDD